MKRLLLLTDGPVSHASSRIRGLDYVPLLEAAGYSVTWHARVEERRSGLGRVRFALDKRWRTIRLRWLLRRPWDVVLVQRWLLPPQARTLLARRGIPVVYDFDDALYLDQPAETAEMARLADAVVVASPVLAGWAAEQGARAEVIPTPVEVDRLHPAAFSPARFTIGWIGSPWTTSYLNLLAEPLKQLAASGLDLRVLAVGAHAATLDLPEVEVDVVPWRLEEEGARLRDMSVGVMPLPDEPFAAGKGAYKLYQYMATGLPIVASPVGVNRQVVTPEVGVLCASGAAWVEALGRLASDADLGRRLGAAGRRRAEAQYSRTVCFARLHSLLDELTA